MWEDTIVEEVRRVREAHAAKYGYDLRAIYEALKAAEAASDREKVSFDPKRIPPQRREIKAALKV